MPSGVCILRRARPASRHFEYALAAFPVPLNEATWDSWTFRLFYRTPELFGKGSRHPLRVLGALQPNGYGGNLALASFHKVTWQIAGGLHATARWDLDPRDDQNPVKSAFTLELVAVN